MKLTPMSSFTLAASLFLSSAIATHSPSAHAAPIQEIWFSARPLDSLQMDEWKKAPSTTRLRIYLEDPTPSQLDELTPIQQAKRLELVVGRYPDPSTLPSYQRLSKIHPLWLAVTEGGFPVSPEIDRLNQLRIEKLVLVFAGIPSPGPAKELARIQAPLSLTYATREYPKFMDRDAWETLPKTVPLLISTDYWPHYNAMDILNVLKLKTPIRVRDSFPPEESWPYLLNIRGLTQVELESEWDGPQDQTWNRFGKLPVRWTRKNTPPMETGLAHFEASLSAGPRELLLDFDSPLTAQEKNRLERSPLPVTWLRNIDSKQFEMREVVRDLR